MFSGASPFSRAMPGVLARKTNESCAPPARLASTCMIRSSWSEIIFNGEWDAFMLIAQFFHSTNIHVGI